MNYKTIKIPLIIITIIFCSIFLLNELKDKCNYSFISWKQSTDNPKPIYWPIQTPYWTKATKLSTGYWDMCAVVKGDRYDAILEIKKSWPEAEAIETKSVPFFRFSDYLVCPEWLDSDTWEYIEEISN